MKKNLRKAVLPAVMSAALMLGAFSAPAAEKEDVTMAFCTWTGYAPMFIAQEKGYFDLAGSTIVLLMESERVALLPEQLREQLIRKGQGSAIEMRIEAAETVEAPVEAGQKLGTVRFVSDGEELLSCDLIAASAVPKLGFWTALTRILAHVF